MHSGLPLVIVGQSLRLPVGRTTLCPAAIPLVGLNGVVGQDWALVHAIHVTYNIN